MPRPVPAGRNLIPHRSYELCTATNPPNNPNLDRNRNRNPNPKARAGNSCSSWKGEARLKRSDEGQDSEVRIKKHGFTIRASAIVRRRSMVTVMITVSSLVFGLGFALGLEGQG